LASLLGQLGEADAGLLHYRAAFEKGDVKVRVAAVAGMAQLDSAP